MLFVISKKRLRKIDKGEGGSEPRCQHGVSGGWGPLKETYITFLCKDAWGMAKKQAESQQLGVGVGRGCLARV